MDYQPRTIGLLAELLHAPHGGDLATLQKVHDRLFSSGSPPYAGFQALPQGALLSNPAPKPGIVSQAALLRDRIQLREENTALTPEAFGARLRRVVEAASSVLGIQALPVVQVILRSLVNPRHWTDTRAFMRERVLGFGRELDALGREPAIYGVRLSFPPREGGTDAIELKVESSVRDPRDLYLEVQAAAGPIALPTSLPALEEHVRTTYGFLTERALGFVARFDAKQAT